MKSCPSCGKEVQDSAAPSSERGTESQASSPAPSVLQRREAPGDSIKLFRVLVLVGNGAYLLSSIVPYVESRFMSDETLHLLERSGHGALVTLPPGIYWLMVALYMAMAVGLYQFSASARTGFTIFTLAMPVLNLFTGVGVTSPLCLFLGGITAMADGGILLLAHFTTLRTRFA